MIKIERLEDVRTCPDLSASAVIFHFVFVNAGYIVSFVSSRNKIVGTLFYSSFIV